MSFVIPLFNMSANCVSIHNNSLAEIDYACPGEGALRTEPKVSVHRRPRCTHRSYSWRHRFATQLQDIPSTEGRANTPERRRFMTGHAAPDTLEKRYLEHPPAKLKPLIDTLPDPTGPLTRRTPGLE